ncbi:MAG TPA: DHHA1 domain-containing protein [Candidatus Deferrimicrobium sp.]|nr:DHHA1 domain-containing protein [Candidatus Deferrimicrobium sp.]
MTKRLYYTDSKLLSFEATIVGVEFRDGLHYTVLDQSAFYPTSGGQLHDLGTLNEVEIVDVIETKANDVCHVSRTPVGRVGESVHGLIDKDRRWINRQMHTAQHILSQVFVRLYNYPTVSVHLGLEYGAVELDPAEVTPEQLAAAELTAQEMIEANLPVTILFVSGEEARTLPLRRPPARSENVRVIRIGEFDWSACGGTHCESTGEIGLIKCLGVDKIRGHALVRFLAGRQAMTDYCDRFAVTSLLARKFSCHVTDLADRVDKLVAEQGALREEILRLHKELLPVRAANLAAMAEVWGTCSCVCHEIEPLDERTARLLAEKVADQIRGVALLFVSGKLLIVASPDSKIDAGQLSRRAAERASLKGGGNVRVAQLGGLEADRLAEYRETLKELISHA